MILSLREETHSACATNRVAPWSSSAIKAFALSLGSCLESMRTLTCRLLPVVAPQFLSKLTYFHAPSGARCSAGGPPLWNHCDADRTDSQGRAHFANSRREGGSRSSPRSGCDSAGALSSSFIRLKSSAGDPAGSSGGVPPALARLKKR